MIKYLNDCVGCPQGCGHCGAKKTKHYFCDKCGDEFEPEELYDVDDEMLCTTCLLNNFDTVAQHPDKWDE